MSDSLKQTKKTASWKTICSRELSSYFTSPIPYIVCAVFLLIAGIRFFSTFFLIKRAELRDFFEYLPYLFCLFIPALTMRVFSEEKRSGSIETLLTLPVTARSVVAGKFIASFISCAMLLVPTLFYVITCALLGEVDSGPIIGGYIGALLLAASYCAIGIFSSAMTKNQIVAFFISFAICAFLSFCGMFAILLPPALVKFVTAISSTLHFESISRGILDSRNVIYFLSLTAVFYVFTIIAVEDSKKKNPMPDKILFVAAIILLNLVCSKAFIRADLTNAKSYSLSQSSIQTVRTLEEPLQIKVFFSENLPSDQNSVSQYVKDMLSEYKTAAGKNLSVEFYNADKEENARLASEYGLQQIQIQEIKNNEVGFKNVFMGIVLSYADQIECIDPITDGSGLEYKITTSISRVIRNTNILAGMKETPKLTLYKSNGLLNFEIGGIDSVEESVKNAYEIVNKKNNGKIEFESLSPSSSEAESLFTKYGVQKITMKDAGRSPSFASLGLVLECNDSYRLIPLRMVSMELIPGVKVNAIDGLNNLEENISSALESLVSNAQAISYVTTHGCMSIDDPQGNGAANIASLIGENYILEPLDLAAEEIPVGVQSVIINGPKEEFTQAELFKIDQFLMKGGHLILFLDPYLEQYPQDPSDPYAQIKYITNKTGLEQILGKNGITLEQNYVLDEQCFTRPVQQYGKLNFYHAPLMQKENLASKNPITQNLAYVLFLQSGEITTEQDSGQIKYTKIASSSKKGWTVSADENANINIDPRFIVPPQASEQGVHTMAVLAEGKFTSSFTGPLPAGENPAENEILESDTFVANGTQKAKIFVAGTSIITGPDLISQNSSEPIALFIQNVVDYMNGNEDLCQMRTKGLSLNPLHITSGPIAAFAKYFNQAGLAILVAIAGLVVIVLRKKRRNQIRKEFSGEDK